MFGPCRDSKVYLRPLSFLFSLLMVFACVLLPAEYSSFSLLSLLFWAAMAVVGEGT